jgi:hypothetical protein
MVWNLEMGRSPKIGSIGERKFHGDVFKILYFVFFWKIMGKKNPP